MGLAGLVRLLGADKSRRGMSDPRRSCRDPPSTDVDVTAEAAVDADDPPLHADGGTDTGGGSGLCSSSSSSCVGLVENAGRATSAVRPASIRSLSRSANASISASAAASSSSSVLGPAVDAEAGSGSGVSARKEESAERGMKAGREWRRSEREEKGSGGREGVAVANVEVDGCG